MIRYIRRINVKEVGEKDGELVHWYRWAFKVWMWGQEN